MFLGALELKITANRIALSIFTGQKASRSFSFNSLFIILIACFRDSTKKCSWAICVYIQKSIHSV